MPLDRMDLLLQQGAQGLWAAHRGAALVYRPGENPRHLPPLATAKVPDGILRPFSKMPNSLRASLPVSVGCLKYGEAGGLRAFDLCSAE